MRCLQEIYWALLRRLKLHRGSFQKLDTGKSGVISLQLLCQTFHAAVYYVPLRNLILREASKDPQKYRYILLRVDLDSDFYFTAEGLQAFREIFVNYFDEAGFDYLCCGLCALSESAKK